MTLTLDPQTVEHEAATPSSPRSRAGCRITSASNWPPMSWACGIRRSSASGAAPRDRRVPRPDRVRRRLMLVDAYGETTARAWLLGSNSRLDDEAPAWLLRHAEDPGDVRFLVPAARAFAVGAA